MPFAKCAIYLTNIYVVRKEPSLPMRERGLKQDYLAGVYTDEKSLPMRERGLKH